MIGLLTSRPALYVGAAVGLLLAGLVMGLRLEGSRCKARIDKMERARLEAVAQQQAKVLEVERAAQAARQEVENAYQTRLAALAADHRARLRRLRDHANGSGAVSADPAAAGRADDPAADGLPESLRPAADEIAVCRQQAEQLQALQDYIRAVTQ